MIITDDTFIILFFEIVVGFASVIGLLLKKEYKQERRIDGIESRSKNNEERVENVEKRVTALEAKIK